MKFFRNLLIKLGQMLLEGLRNMVKLNIPYLVHVAVFQLHHGFLDVPSSADPLEPTHRRGAVVLDAAAQRPRLADAPLAVLEVPVEHLQPERGFPS